MTTPRQPEQPDPTPELPVVESGFRTALTRTHGDVTPPDVHLREDGSGGEGRASARLDSLRAEGPGAARRYVLEGEIGRGGMGAVLEIFDSDLRRRLAMKVALSSEGGSDGATSVDSEQLVRFLEEAQVTGQLDHPGVVPVHELGVDAEGRVYFTMRLVRGQELTKVFEAVHAGDAEWNLTRALGALLKVCEAMSYAHDKGVVHRDLKPANVMVGRHGEVYVMDWGLARVDGRKEAHDIRPRTTGVTLSRVRTDRRDEEQSADDSPILTMDGSVLGTPFFMPPEQAAGRLQDIGPRSDVYALGAMLYALLSGRMPYHRPGDRASAHTILAMVLHGPPQSIHSLAPHVPAELEAICEKAMAREPDDRYADMGELGDDLRAYLEDRVVRAHRTGAVVELRKWVARNRALAVSLAAIVLLVAGGSTTAALVLGAKNKEIAGARDAAETARDASERVTSFLVGRLESLEPEETLGQPISVSDFLDGAAAALASELADASLESAELRAVVGNAYRSLGRYDVAEPLLLRAAADRRDLLGARHPDTLDVLHDVAVLYENQGRFEESERLHVQTLEAQRAVLSEDHPDTLSTLADLAFLLESMDRIEEAVPLYESVLERRNAVLGPDASETLVSLGDLGLAYEWLGRHAEAEPLMLRAVESTRRVHGDRHPDTLSALGNLALLRGSQGRTAEAEALYESVVTGSRDVLGSDHPDTLATLNNYALLLDEDGRGAEAEPLYLEVLEVSRRTLGEDHPDTLTTLQHLAEMYEEMGRTEDAARLAR